MEKIEGTGEQCESIRCYVLTALLSGPNNKFNGFIDRIQDGIESGTSVHSKMTWKDIILSARTKFKKYFPFLNWILASKEFFAHICASPSKTLIELLIKLVLCKFWIAMTLKPKSKPNPKTKTKTKTKTKIKTKTQNQAHH